MIGCDTNLSSVGNSENNSEQVSRISGEGVLADRRSETLEGVFAISKAEQPKGFEGGAIGSLAWWNDFATDKMFVYSRLMYSNSDVNQALINLERDLAVDSSNLIAEFSAVGSDSNNANQPEDQTTWQPATYALALEIMGFDPAEFAEAGKIPNDPFTPECVSYKSVSAYKASLESLPFPLKAIEFGLNSKCGNGSFGGCVCAPGGYPCGCPDDGNPCTLDICNVFGFCTHFYVPGPCCPGDICYPDCSDDLCDCMDDCDDGNFCNGVEGCSNGNCTPGTPLVCDDPDGDVCNGILVCNPSIGCQATPSLVCDDDNACNGLETCDPIGGCQNGVPPVCQDPDNNVCNGSIFCNPSSGCVLIPALVCDDGDACNGVETCNPLTGCQMGALLVCDDDGDACNGPEFCDSSSGCMSGPMLECDDENVCNGMEICDPASGCVEGTPLSCANDDGDVCNGVENCDPVVGCVMGGISAPPICDDDDECNGIETCDPTLGCQDGPPLLCEDNDNDVCNGTVTCDPVLGCQTQPPLMCDDGDDCNGIEICDPIDGCIAEMPIYCNDGNPCTTDACIDGECSFGLPNCENSGNSCGSAEFSNHYAFCDNCTVTMSIPSTIQLNCDDDNNNGIPDYQDSGPVTGENDLVPVSISLSGCPGLADGDPQPGDEVQWHLNGWGGNNFRAYLDSDKSTLASQSGSWPPPSVVYLEGVKASNGVCPTRVVLWVSVLYENGGICTYCGYEGGRTSVEGFAIDLDVDSDNNKGIAFPSRSLNEDTIEGNSPGKIILVNDDDDDNSNLPDNTQEPPFFFDDDLVPIVLEFQQDALETNAWKLVYEPAFVQIYKEDRKTIITSGKIFNMVVSPNTQTYWMEGIAPSTSAGTTITISSDSNGDGLYDCSDSVVVTVMRIEMDTITSGIDPIPVNPAIVAPMNPLGLDDGELFWDANTFGLTKIQPDIDLTTIPANWVFKVTSGFINPTSQVIEAADKRSAVLEIPFPSFGNRGDGRMEFRIGDHVYAEVYNKIKNVQPDLEPGDFRFQVKAHLCTDGAGASTSRTETEIRAIMSDVSKILSQCGIIVTLSNVVTTTVDPAYIRLDSTSASALHGLIGFGIDDSIIDVYFIEAIDYDVNQGCGYTAGITSSPGNQLAYKGGIVLADNVCDGSTDIQAAVRTFAHELVHYLYNHDDADADADHIENEEKNLMSRGQSTTKRDLTMSQCLEIRANRGGN